MQLKLYKTKGTYNTLGIELSDELILDIPQLNHQFDEESPSFLIRGRGEDYKDYNYCIFNGYRYFITDRIDNNSGLVALPCIMDYLNQFKNDILNFDCYVTRSNFVENYIPNEVDVLSSEDDIEFITSNDKFDDTEEGGIYVLVTSQNGYEGV